MRAQRELEAIDESDDPTLASEATATRAGSSGIPPRARRDEALAAAGLRLEQDGVPRERIGHVADRHARHQSPYSTRSRVLLGRLASFQSASIRGFWSREIVRELWRTFES